MLCLLGELLAKAVWLYTIALLIYAVLSWIPDLRGRWSDYLAMIIEPVLMPLRRVIPPLGGLDLSFLVLLLLLQFLVLPLIGRFEAQACFAGY